MFFIESNSENWLFFPTAWSVASFDESEVAFSDNVAFVDKPFTSTTFVTTCSLSLPFSSTSFAFFDAVPFFCASDFAWSVFFALFISTIFFFPFDCLVLDFPPKTASSISILIASSASSFDSAVFFLSAVLIFPSVGSRIPFRLLSSRPDCFLDCSDLAAVVPLTFFSVGFLPRLFFSSFSEPICMPSFEPFSVRDLVTVSPASIVSTPFSLSTGPFAERPRPELPSFGSSLLSLP
mmetsp:Transcript_33934/g.52913  ORF Transcript_33934/g.52913 Transcript_33934/m.52913 type:complete len:236 (-) Transcript_33934:390-1097(-)